MFATFHMRNVDAKVFSVQMSALKVDLKLNSGFLFCLHPRALAIMGQFNVLH